MRINQIVEAWTNDTESLHNVITKHLRDQAQRWIGSYKLPEYYYWSSWSNGNDFAVFCNKDKYTYVVYWSMGNNECIFYRVKGELENPEIAYYCHCEDDDGNIMLEYPM